MNIMQDLCFVHQKFHNSTEVFDFISPILMKKNMVSEEYYQQIVARESHNPTGFDLEYMGVAIPHIDSQYVKKDGLWVMTFAEPCDWLNVETNAPLKISIVFGLLLSSADNHVDFLQKLTAQFSNISLMKNISHASDSKELYDILINIL